VPNCGNYEGFYPKTAVLMIIGIMILAPEVTLTNNTFAQTSLPIHNRTLYEIAKQTSGLVENPHIDVGNSPYAIAINEVKNIVYVVNSDFEAGFDTVSVISAENNSKIKDITVGNNPTGIAVDESRNVVYVANSGSYFSEESDSNNTVSVISGENYTKTKDIIIGNIGGDEHDPIGIAVDESRNVVYVANSLSYFSEESDSTEVDSTDVVSVISGENYTKTKDISLEGEARSIVLDYWSDDSLQDHSTIFVANGPYLSAISGDNFTKIGEDLFLDAYGYMHFEPSLSNIYIAEPDYNNISVISVRENDVEIEKEDIPVGEEPQAIAVNSYSYIAYVANAANNTVSVINGTTYEPVRNVTTNKPIEISVGELPISIAVREDISDDFDDNSTIYIVNQYSDTVSVISAENNSKIKDITVGNNPTAIGISSNTDTIYVANSGSNTVSVIDGSANEIIAGVTFQVNPFNSGYIVCDDLSTASTDDLTPPSPIGEHIYVYSGAQCIAKPNEGFEFVSWEENSGINSTRPIQVSRSASAWDSFVLAVTDFFGDKPDEPEAKLNITKFGTFTANFRELPPPLPPEFWAQMSAVIGTVVTALFIPSIVSWFKSKRDAKKLSYYHKETASLHKKIGSMKGDDKPDENDMKTLNELRNNIADAYSHGKLSEKHYESLRNETSVLYEKTFRERINHSLNNNNNPSDKKLKQEQLGQIRKEVKYAYSEGKINDKHYALLNEDISKLEGKESQIA
jgi:YVTN family beta-propeller protein